MARKPKRPRPPKKVGPATWQVDCPECSWKRKVDGDDAAPASGMLLLHGMGQHNWPMNHLEG